ncbi:MAG: phosphonate ABC transporter, permease protein PhnE [Nitriliruptoraceae bacterium]
MTIPQTPTHTPPRVRTTTASATRPERPRRYGPLGLALTLLAAGLWAAWTSGIDLAAVLRGPQAFVRILALMFLPPDASAIPGALSGMVESLQIAWIGTIIGALISLPLGLLAAKNVGGRISPTVSRQVLNLLRSLPELVLAILFVSMIGLGPLAGTLAIGLGSIGTLGKLTAEVVEGIDRGPIEASEAVGGGRFQVLRWGVLPQAMPEIIAFWLYRFEINVRASAILGLVGAGGIGGMLANFLSYRRYGSAGTAILIVIATTIAIDIASSRIRRRIITGKSATKHSLEPLAQVVTP